MNVKRMGVSHLLVPFLALSVITVLTYWSLFVSTEPLKVNSTEVAVIEKIPLGPTMKLNTKRTVASVNSEVIVLDCKQLQQKLIRISSKSSTLRFENCAPTFLKSKKSLTNLTNHYVAQFFESNIKSKPNSFSTDFIQFEPGVNTLKFEISLNGEQKKTQTIKIERVQSEIQ